MKKRKRTRLLIGSGCLLLSGCALLLWLRPPGPNIICHRGLDGAFMIWSAETTNGDWYPNVDGSSAKSLSVIARYYGPDPKALRDYRYVPGLKRDDPKDLILAYVTEPSRRRWHGDGHWFRKEKRWVVLNPRIENAEDDQLDRWGELAECIPADELENRLAKTLRFLSVNQRNSCTNVVMEHQKLLQELHNKHRYAQR